MDGPLFSVVAVALWVTAGPIGTALMTRPGHPHPPWLLRGVLLGPLAAAVLSERADHSPRTVIAPVPGVPGTGGADVKGRSGGFRVPGGIGGETGVDRIVKATGRLLRFRPGRVVSTTVIDHDTAGTADRAATASAGGGATDTDPARRRAREEIDRAPRPLKGCAVALVRFHATPPPLVEIADGRPAAAPVDLARAEGPDVIVVDSPLHRAHPPRGGVCRELPDHSPGPVPVAAGGGHREQRRTAPHTPTGDGRRRATPGSAGPSTPAAA
ncbi:hypothetical protein [Streptomyces sp. ST2-7A]|uniref:hypothetical protein n=1 Tax=Streptomyces sp. ST2-7A TaxID=2907214 RepID=UPI001F1B745C|nr:hypothetical protein [Streptomyces sp. ST2-7A]MCE7079140.1 hypothetical protein [Streptomyces sp. ST2-7A]